MNKVTEMQVDDILEQIIIDLNPEISGDDPLVEALESGTYHPEAAEYLINYLKEIYVE